MNKITVDASKITGKIKPLHAVNNGPLGGPGHGKWEYLEEAGIPYARLHDTGGAYGGHVYVDIANVFRNFDADPSDPSSYDFAFTDWLLSTLNEHGTKPFYRLGSTIENAHRIKAYNIYPPKDNLKWAKICEGIIRHYNEGWANGFHFDIEYWEIWNEPDNEPEIADNPMWKGTKEQFFELYQVTASYLKEKFPHLKIGGYASCGFYKIANIAADPNANISPRIDYFVTFFHEFLKYISDEKHKAPLDFFSWHSYSSVKSNVIFSNYARKTLDEYGFTQTEQLCNEWNPSRTLRGTLRDATNILANMLVLHKTSISMMMYYDWRLNCGYCGALNPLDFTPFKAFYAFKAFNELYRLKNEISAISDNEGIITLAAANEQTLKIAIVNYTDQDAEVELNLNGAKIEEVLVVDEEHTYEPIEICGSTVKMKKDAIILVKAKV